jgi:amino acid transporter
VIGGMMSAFGMFNALVMSYSRLPLAMARDGMLPKIFAKTTQKSQTPWVAILVCASCWGLCLGLGFKKLVTLDIMLYGASLMLEFVTLVVLRIREPELKREFKVPGGLVGAISCGIFPLLLMSLAMVESESESILGINGLLFGLIIMVGGVVLYAATKPLRRSVIAPAATPNAVTGD